MTVIEAGPGRARLKVTLPGRLRSRQGINLPGSRSGRQVADRQGPARPRLDRAARRDVEYVGLSFVRSADDVARLRRGARPARNCPARIVAKIEKPQAVEHLEAIVAATDAVMVARGDLGVEMDVRGCRRSRSGSSRCATRPTVPVITATQMLNSMEHSSRPTRAEASDVFNAVLDGTDAVMLSGETRRRRVSGRGGRDHARRSAPRPRRT